MNSLRIEADESHKEAEDFKAQVKSLEQQNLSKEQEITSLSHKNQLLEAEVEKLEKVVKDAKIAAEEGSHHGAANENLTRRLQLLEEEAEQADRNLRDTNEKSVAPLFLIGQIGQSLLHARENKKLTFYSLQASPNRRQGWPFRA
jgi:tropomyosin, fungi type